MGERPGREQGDNLLELVEALLVLVLEPRVLLDVLALELLGLRLELQAQLLVLSPEPHLCDNTGEGGGLSASTPDLGAPSLFRPAWRPLCFAP